MAKKKPAKQTESEEKLTMFTVNTKGKQIGVKYCAVCGQRLEEGQCPKGHGKAG